MTHGRDHTAAYSEMSTKCHPSQKKSLTVWGDRGTSQNVLKAGVRVGSKRTAHRRSEEEGKAVFGAAQTFGVSVLMGRDTHGNQTRAPYGLLKNVTWMEGAGRVAAMKVPVPR